MVFGWLKRRKEKEQEEISQKGINRVVYGLKAMKEAGKSLYSGESEDEQIKKGFESEIRNVVFGFVDKFSEKTGLNISREHYPKVNFVPHTRAPHGIIKTQIPTSHFGGITITEDKMYDKDAYTEEISHFVRSSFRPGEAKDSNVEEFFGFLGRKIMQHNKNINSPFASDADFQAHISQLDRQITNPAIESHIKSRLITEKNDALSHYEGYKYASQVDLSKVHNFKNLYSLPSKEVRRRFFTPKPDYSGL